MTTTTATMTNTTTARATGALLVFEALLLFVPVAILGSAINWPASLSEPPSVILPLIQQQATQFALAI